MKNANHRLYRKFLGLVAVSSFALALPSKSFAAGDCPVVTIPIEMKASERVFSIGTSLDLYDGSGNGIGSIEQKLFNLTTTFQYKNDRGQEVAVGKKRMFAWGSVVDVYDCNDRLIGTVKEEIFKSLMKVNTQYTILDGKGREVGKSEKVELLGTKIQVQNLKGETVLNMERPFINVISDTWNIQVKNKKAIDPRVLMMVPAFKTASDNERRKESKKDKKRSSTASLGMLSIPLAVSDRQGANSLKSSSSENSSPVGLESSASSMGAELAK